MNRQEKQIIREAVGKARLTPGEKEQVYRMLTEGDEGGLVDAITGDGVSYSELPNLADVIMKMSWMDRLVAFSLLAEWLIDWMPNLAGSLDKVFGDGKAGFFVKGLRMISRVVGGPLILAAKGVRSVIDKCKKLTEEEKKQIEAQTKQDPAEQKLNETVIRGHIRQILISNKGR